MPKIKSKNTETTDRKKTTGKKEITRKSNLEKTAPSSAKKIGGSARKTSSTKSATKKAVTTKTASSSKTKVIAKKTTAKKTAAGTAKKPPASKATGAASRVKKNEMAKKSTDNKPKTATKKTKGGKVSFKKEMTEKLQMAKTRILTEVSQKIKSESNVHKYEIGDIYDLASSERERELALTLGDRDRVKLSEIEDALERINNDTYGECEECGEPIEEGRLKALPFTRVCVECQSRLEREQRIKGRFEEESGLGGIVEKSENEEEL